MPRPKRSLDELIKSDSNDDDYSDHAPHSARKSTSKSKASRKKPKPAKKRRRRSFEADLSSGDELLSDSDPLTPEEEEEEEEDDDDDGNENDEEAEYVDGAARAGRANTKKNLRGTVRRKAAQNRVRYRESDTDDIFDESASEEEHPAENVVVSENKKGSTVVRLKLGRPMPLDEPASTRDHHPITRRSTRRTRDPSEDIYALTNSGRHVETVEKGTKSPEVQSAKRPPLQQQHQHQQRKTRASSGAIPELKEFDELGPQQTLPGRIEDDEIQDTTAETRVSQFEILESAPGSFQDPNKADADMADEDGFIPDSENGDAKNEGGNALHADDDKKLDEEDEEDVEPSSRRNGRQRSNNALQNTDFEIGEEQNGNNSSRPRRSSRKQPPRNSQRKAQDESDFEPEEEESNDEELSGSARSNKFSGKLSHEEDDDGSVSGRRPGLRKRKSRSRGDSEALADIAGELAEELQDLRSSRPRRKLQSDIVYEKPRRSRKDVDYRILRPELALPIEEAENEVVESPSRRGRGGGGNGTWQRALLPTYGPFGGGGPPAILTAEGFPAAAAGNVDSDSSDDEGVQHPRGLGIGMTPTTAAGATAGTTAGAAFTTPAQLHSGDAVQISSGTPANLGKIKDRHALADADPLGVDMTVNFDNVGGLQGHIDQLKEMVSLPLLYPEVFQRFHVVPPRGVLFHGPPGTGKTLLARALANSVSSEGRKVTFYMRKGADALSKWVGEAERQLRLLFEEARKTQPSIIFFDEIDGLAPVRSSKQEQIHASIVSTLLALMDGMDGRGQVIVIGATNRPDSIDPALRRPGRFDREFYFPLPNTEGRRAILDIHTKGWDPPLPEQMKSELAEITKGYGGADLRALCTEAALNAVQRRYPQIYKSEHKLRIDPTKIEVTPKDFMIAVKKMVPSSERSTSSGASPLPDEIEPLLSEPLAEIKKVLAEILPQKKPLTALEEAQFEEPLAAGDFKREQMQQAFERSRIFRPRLLIGGPQGMGQQYLAAALLHHFEGLHVQAFDLPALLGDSSRSPEAAVIQLFGEVKRHKPSVIYIPNIQSWFETVGPTVISTLLGLLRSIPPTDPILVLGVLELANEDVDSSLIRNLFGYSKRNLYDLKAPSSHARYEFFKTVVGYIKTSPSEFPDPENRKRREHEVLEVVPPEPPKPAAPLTKEALKAQKRKDRQALNLLKIRIQPIMDQIKKYKRFRTGVVDESQIRYLWEDDDPNVVTSDLPIEQRTTFRPFEKAVDKHGVPGLRETVSGKFYYNLEIVTIEKRLSNGFYKRPKDFLADIKRLAKDAKVLGDSERMLRANELLSNVEVDISMIEQTDAALVAECEQVYLRELERERQEMELAKAAAEEGRAFTGNAAALKNVPHGNTESTVSSGPVVLGEAFPSDRHSRASARPVTPSRPSSRSFMTNGYNRGNGGGGGGGGGGSDLNDLDAHAVTSINGSHASHPDGDGDVYMTNSEDHSGDRDGETQVSSFGPSAQLKPPYSHTAPSQQIRRESGLSSLSQRGPMTPMAPGSYPNDYTNEASTTQTTSDKKSSEQSVVHYQHTQSPNASQSHALRHEYPDLTQYPDRVSQEEHLPDTQQGVGSQQSPNSRESQTAAGHGDLLNSQNSGLNGSSQSQSRSQPPVPLFRAAAATTAMATATTRVPSHLPSNLQALLNKEEQPPKLILDAEYVEDLHQQLAQRTSGFSIEQLEQINSSLMDYIWGMRGEWNRTKVVTGVLGTFNDVLEDMLSAQEIGPASQDSLLQHNRSSIQARTI